MNNRTRAEVDELFRSAEESGRLVIGESRTIRKRLERLVDSGRAFRPSRGVYVRADYWRGLDGRQKALHVMRTLTERDHETVFSHVSAALAHGLEVPWRHARRLHAVTAGRGAPRTHGWVVRHSGPAADAVMVGGVRATPLMRTVFDCLRTLDMPEGLAVADSALRVGGLEMDELRSFFDGRRAYDGHLHAVRTLHLADKRSENGGESIARGVMLELGCVPPELQEPVNDPVSGVEYRADFHWRLDDDQVVIGELDGRDKYLDPDMTGGKGVEEVLMAERLRESRINASGIRVMRFRFSELANRRKFSELLDMFNVPRGYELPKDHPHPRLDQGITFRRKARVR